MIVIALTMFPYELVVAHFTLMRDLINKLKELFSIDRYIIMSKLSDDTLYNLIGGRPTLDKVHKIFYDKIYKDPWIGKFFQGIQQEIIETQQSDFMSQAMGGPAMYLGKLVVPAHKHMFITEELFELRTQYLKDSLLEAGISQQNQLLWLKIDQAFKKGIIKKDVSDCVLRFNTDEILHFPNFVKKSA